MKKDNIFEKKIEKVPLFSFDEKVSEVFDDMVCRSIPMYQEVQNLTAQVITKKYHFKGIVYDLGCSTGNSLYTISTHLKNEKLKMIGIDSSKYMIQKCEKTLSSYKFPGNLKVYQHDILTMDFLQAEIIIMHYTLQFVSHSQKKNLLKKIYEDLPLGGIFIFSEKSKESDEEFEDIFTEFYHNFKKEQGYSELEISQKRESLDNFIKPLSVQNLLLMLQEVGFSQITTLCQFLHFSTFLVIK